ncbi:hypothetical protein C0995_008301 [Termitomyces sp. Mi166|nr:hypothetical protein C0995_008301 [Termitomyces sp. Mi166\
MPGPYDFGAAKDQEWFVDDLLSHWWNEQGHLEFEVRWSLGDTTWEPLASCKDLAALDRYLVLQGEHAPYAQPVNKALLQCLERAGQPVPATAAFLQDSLAIVIVEGLLDQIEMMKRQHVTMLEHIERAGKHKAPAYEEWMVEPKWARAPARQPQEFVWTPAPTAVRPLLPPVQPPSLLATLISVRLDSVLPWSSQEPDIPAIVENPLAKLSLEPRNKIMTNAPAMQQEQRVEVPHMPVMSSQAGLSSQGEACLAPEIPELKAQPAAVESHRLSTSSYALDVLRPTKHRRG